MIDPIVIGKFIGGVAALIFGARLLVIGASKLALAVGLPTLVIGLTVVAFGTGSPELAVTLGSAITGAEDIGLGNVIGSNIANILFVVGISSLVIPMPVQTRLVRWDIPIMIVVSVGLLLLTIDGNLNRIDGAILFTGIVLYTILSIVYGRRSQSAESENATDESSKTDKPKNTRGIPIQFGLIVIGLILLIFGARYLVEAATEMASALGVNDLVIGLTLVAIGTSLPEAATSLVASIRGERDIAIGNAVGSNIFNILAVLGLTALVSPIGISVSPGVLRFDLPIMIAVAVATLPIVITGQRIARWEGFLFVLYYFAYIAYVYYSDLKEGETPVFDAVMLIFVIPLTILGLGVSLLRALRSHRIRRAEKAKSEEAPSTE